MSNTAVSSQLQALGYAVETAFAEQVDTYATRLTVANISVALSQPMLDRGALQQRQNDGVAGVRGPKGGSLSFDVELYGHGTTTSDTLTATPLYTLLGYLVGGSSATTVAKAVSGNWANAYSGDLAAGSTIAAGTIVNIGSLNDGYANGQPAAVSGLSTNTLTLLTALPGNPQDSHQLYGNLMVYPVDSASVANTLRFWVASGNQQYWARGCTLSAIKFSGLAEGQVPRVSITCHVASWEYAEETFPSATATSDKSPTVCGAGSFFLAAFGTATRATYVPRNFEIEISWDVKAVPGPGGADTHQSIVGYRRVKSNCTISFALEAEAYNAHTWYNYWDTDENSIVAKHVLYGLSIADGKRIAFYFPYCLPVDEKPRQADVDGLNYVPVKLACYNSTTTTTDLTMSPWRIAMG